MLKKSSKAVILSIGLTVGVIAAASPAITTAQNSQSQNAQHNQGQNQYDYKLFINKKQQKNAEIKVIEETTYVPLRNLMDSIGAEIAWVQSTAIIVKGSTKVQVVANNENPNSSVKIGNEWVTLKDAPFIDGGRVYVPLEFVEEIGSTAKWQNKNKLDITISEAKYDKLAQVGNWGRWGADDERGTLNLITPEKVLEAASLIKEGKSYNLGRLVDENVWGWPARPQFKLEIESTEHVSDSPMWSFEEYIEGTLQWATQMDGLNHAGIGPYLYNGFDTREFYPLPGDDPVVWPDAPKLGIENAGQVFTRGVLLDIASIRGVEMMEEGDEITVEDLQAALDAQNVEIKSGDAVILHTGWGSLWHTDPERFNSNEPGIGVEAALWLAKQDVALIGSDTWALEVRPNESISNIPFHVHQILLTEYGINLLENIVTEELAADEVYEFAFTLTPLQIKGATASNISPAAYY